MATVDIGKAATAGIRVIRRNPTAVLVWAGVLLVLGVLPAVGLVSAFFSAVVELMRAEASGEEPAMDALMPALSAAFAMQPVLLVTGLIVRAVLTAAVFRSVLQPSESRWFYLRFGTQELLVGLMIVVIGILASLVAMPVGMLTVPFFMIAAAMTQDGPALIVPAVLAVLVSLALIIWLMIRFSMALPMTFAQRQFRLFESWTLTRGHVLRLLGVGLVLVAMVIGIELLMALVLVAVSFGLYGAGGLDEAAVAAFFAQDASIWVAELAPWAIGVALLGALLGAVVTTVMTAPWAEAWRQLSGDGAEPSA